MKFSILTTLASSIATTNALWTGFSIGNRLHGVCKSQEDWASDFATMKSLPNPNSAGPYNAVHLYASSDCATLQNAVPAAIAAGIKIFGGLWTVDDTNYALEKQAVLDAVQQYGVDWLIGLNVGSESLYRKEQTASNLAAQINDVRALMSSVPNGAQVPIGHADTWSVWIGMLNDAIGDVTEVIDAVDFLSSNSFPYYEYKKDNSIENAHNVFWDDMTQVGKVCQGKPVWITETGWCSYGETSGGAVCSVENAERYFKEVGCSAFATYHTFYFTLEDDDSALGWGITTGNPRTPKFDLTCPSS